MRKYQLSVAIVLQSIAQIKDMYKDLYESIVGNCDTLLFLGSSENETTKYVSERLGKATIRVQNTSESNGRSGSYSVSWQNKARALMEPNELAILDNQKCIVMVRGFDPLLVPKYILFDHPNFALTGDKDPSRNINNEYLESHFRCLNKRFSSEDQIEADNEAAKNIEESGKNPNGTDQVTASKETPISDKKSMAKAVNARSDSAKDIKAKVHPASDEVMENLGEKKPIKLSKSEASDVEAENAVVVPEPVKKTASVAPQTPSGFDANAGFDFGNELENHKESKPQAPATEDFEGDDNHLPSFTSPENYSSDGNDDGNSWLF